MRDAICIALFLTDFNLLSDHADETKFLTLMSKPLICKFTARACHEMFKTRRSILYNSCDRGWGFAYVIILELWFMSNIFLWCAIQFYTKHIHIHESVWMWIYKYIVFIYDIMYGLLWFNMNPWSSRFINVLKMLKPDETIIFFVIVIVIVQASLSSILIWIHFICKI